MAQEINFAQRKAVSIRGHNRIRAGMKQTAVEWLVNELETHHVFHDIKNTVAFQIAKQMQREQIMQAWIDGMKSVSIAPFEDEFYQDEAERYYENR